MRIMTIETALDTLTDTQIEHLRAEARLACDLEQATMCDRALAGDTAARAECAHVIATAEAMED